MKNKIALGLAALVALTNVKVSAGDREWATVGKVLTGVAAVEVIHRIVNPPTQVVYVQTQPVVYAQPVVVQPQTVVYVSPTPVVYVQPQPAVVVYGAWGYHHHHYHHHYR